MTEPIDAHDQRVRRCPMLGHNVPFSYCRAPGQALPCRKVFDCWWEAFDVVAFVRGHFSASDVERILAPPKEKTATILDLIEKARRAADGRP